MEHNQILQLMVFPLVLDFELIQSVIILLSELELSMYLIGKLFPDIGENPAQVLSLAVVGGHGVLELRRKGLNISLV